MACVVRAFASAGYIDCNKLMGACQAYIGPRKLTRAQAQLPNAAMFTKPDLMYMINSNVWHRDGRDNGRLALGIGPTNTSVWTPARSKARKERCVNNRECPRFCQTC